MRGKKAENEKKNEPRYFTKSVANPTRTNLSIFGKFSVRVNNIEWLPVGRASIFFVVVF